jgi:hypothetical protein
MNKPSTQLQKAGAGSTNIQAHNVTLGPSYSEVREIALDVFRANFVALRGEALEVAERRAAEITEYILQRLQAKSADPPRTLADPAMQEALFRTQQAYALSGDPDLGQVLVNLLEDRAAEPERSLRQVILREALDVAARLTTDQINVLSVLFEVLRVRHSNEDGMTATTPLRSIDKDLAGLPDITWRSADFDYLVFSRCVTTVPVPSANIGGLLLDKYPLLFSEGIERATIPEHLRKAFGFVGDVGHPLWDLYSLDGFSKAHDLVGSTGELRSLAEGAKMSEPKVREFVLGHVEQRTRITLEALEDFMQVRTNLTPIGIAIGHANLSRWSAFDAPSTIWIP